MAFFHHIVLIGMNNPRDTASRAVQRQRMNDDENRATRITPMIVVNSVKNRGHSFKRRDRKRSRDIRPWDEMAQYLSRRDSACVMLKDALIYSTYPAFWTSPRHLNSKCWGRTVCGDGCVE